MSELRCPACQGQKANFIGKEGVGNALSRYANNIYICSECGTREALYGFFWRKRCPPEKIKDKVE